MGQTSSCGIIYWLEKHVTWHCEAWHHVHRVCVHGLLEGVLGGVVCMMLMLCEQRAGSTLNPLQRVTSALSRAGPHQRNVGLNLSPSYMGVHEMAMPVYRYK